MRNSLDFVSTVVYLVIWWNNVPYCQENLKIDLDQGFEQKIKELNLARFSEDIQANVRPVA